MAKSLVIVESPAKVKTINKILGAKFKVVSSMGHLIDLPKSSLGVDLEHNFEPKFIIVRDKQKVLSQLKKEAKSKSQIYVATDPDREGEAIGWNIVHHVSDDGQKVYRVTFQEITKDAVLKAFQHPRSFDQKKVDAQVARRILDRIVGYLISPLLWKKVGSRLSAGRVQSVALRLIVERERQIKNFIPQEYWQIAADLRKAHRHDVLTVQLDKIHNQKADLKTKEQAEKVAAQIKKEHFVVANVIEREVKRNSQPPFITSTLQQDAFNRLGFNANKTMMIAQQLYEGIEIGDGEPVGLITYMRTDSVNIAQEAITKVRQFITKNFGEKYLPKTPNLYKSKKTAQEAHEAIRPTDVMNQPKEIEKYLEPDQFKLYELIWRRFVSCQMTPAVYQNKKIEVTAGPFLFSASGSTLLFDGYLVLDNEVKEEEAKVNLSLYHKGDALELVAVKPTQHFTKPPPRYSDASLVRALEEGGIGRPSTYASIIQTLVVRNYAMRERGYFMATELGMQICDLLVEYFSKIMDIGFMAKMEENLDLVEEGKLNYVKLLHEFYEPFKHELEYATKTIEKTQTFVDRTCPQCGRQMVVKWGRRGKFLSCSGFPQCKFAQPFLLGIKCPQNCGGELVKRRSRQGRAFYGCSNYPKCTYIANKLPEGETADS